MDAEVDLATLGWDDRLAQAFADLDRPDLVAGRVVRGHRGKMFLQTAAGEWLGEVSGRLLHKAESRLDLPAVGDWVAVQPRDDNACFIHALLPRASLFVRQTAGEVTGQQPVAANIDHALLVTGLDHNFNVRRIERYLTLAWESGAEPMVVLNKADLCDDAEAVTEDVRAVAGTAQVVTVSALTGDGIAALRAIFLPGKTGVLLGSSGVGKSTIINALVGDERQKVTAVRDGDGKGRHTTTVRELVMLPDGGMLIDTPGMRELALWAEGDGLGQTFDDIVALAAQCRFNDCQHDREPGCALQAAVQAGEIELSRLVSFQRQRDELSMQGDRLSESRRRKEKRVGKKIAKDKRRYYQDFRPEASE